MEKTRSVIKVSKIKTAIVLIILVVIGLILLGLKLINRPYDPANCGLGCRQITNTLQLRGNKESSSMIPSDYLSPNQNPLINDTREFLKTNYSAAIKTRSVESILLEAKDIVRNVNGRIDNSNENPENGYIGFVIPKSNFENFKYEIEGITHKKLLTENISSENLLGKKQSIESQQEQSNSSLAALQKEQGILIANHNQALKDLQNSTSDMEISFQNISHENSNFDTRNQNLKNQITNMKTRLVDIAQQDLSFNNNIETVSGYISVERISLWEMAKIFSPVSPIIIIIILVLVVWYLLKRKSVIPKIEFV